MPDDGPGIGFGSALTLTKIKQLLKINTYICKQFFNPLIQYYVVMDGYGWDLIF